MPTYTKSERLLKSAEFARIQKIGKKFHTKNFIVVISQGNYDRVKKSTLKRTTKSLGETKATDGRPVSKYVKLGIIITNKIEPKAVSRNRVKRIIREAFRQIKDLCNGGVNLLVIAKQGAQGLNREQTQIQLYAALKHNRLFKSTET